MFGVSFVKYSGKRNKICKWTVRHYVPRTQSLQAFWSAERRPRFLVMTNPSFPESFLASLAWAKSPKNLERRLFNFVFRNEHRTTNQMTGSVGMKKRKNENFNTAISLPDFVLFPLLTFMLSYVQTNAQTSNIVGPTCWELLRPFARR